MIFFKKCIALIFKEIEKMARTFPVILTGDFNISQNSELFLGFSKHSKFKNVYDIAVELKHANTGAVNGFDTFNQSDDRIGHVFLTHDFKVNTYKLALDTYVLHKFPSDHFPIILNIDVSDQYGYFG